MFYPEVKPSWSIAAAIAAIDAFEKASPLDLERSNGPELAIWHLLVSLRDLANGTGIDFDRVAREAAEHGQIEG
jgi:hypothetical protein